MAHRETILVVDDQPENITIMIEALKSAYALVAATDGESALERANSDPRPDLVLLDVMMPEMDGHEVCRRLKADPATQGIPVIFVTALDNPDDEARGLALGAVDYITKPISPPVVAARIKAHLQLTQAKRILERQNEVLEKRVMEKTQDVIRIQKERVAGLNNFANAMAHQIRNPVTSIGGMAGLLVKKTPEGSPLSEYALAVRENSIRLESLVGVISQYLSLTVDTVEAAPVQDVVARAVELAEQRAGEAGRTLRCEMRLEEGDLVVDRDLVVQALAEVLYNAVDFAGSETVSVRIEGGRAICNDNLGAVDQFYATDCRYGVRITDDGPGISPEDMPYLTDPFFTTKAQGVGLGLTKAKRIVCEELRGSMYFDSQPGAGVSVTMTFGRVS